MPEVSRKPAGGDVVNELTLEALAARVAALEEKLAALTTGKPDWRSVVGISEDDEFTRLMLAEIEANSEAERRAALEANPE
jgi:hypothetical protein